MLDPERQQEPNHATTSIFGNEVHTILERSIEKAITRCTQDLVPFIVDSDAV